FLLDNCILNCSLQTSPVTTAELTNHLSISALRLRNIISRIKKKDLIKVISHSSGSNNAHRVFEFPKPIYDELLLVKSKQKVRLENTPLANPLANRNVVSSSNFINTTNIPEEFKDIDFSPLEDYGFTQSHLIQIHKEYQKN